MSMDGCVVQGEAKAGAPVICCRVEEGPAGAGRLGSFGCLASRGRPSPGLVVFFVCA